MSVGTGRGYGIHHPCTAWKLPRSTLFARRSCSHRCAFDAVQRACAMVASTRIGRIQCGLPTAREFKPSRMGRSGSSSPSNTGCGAGCNCVWTTSSPRPTASRSASSAPLKEANTRGFSRTSGTSAARGVHSSFSCVQEFGGGTIESVAHTALVLPFALKKRLGPRRRSRARSGSARKPQAPGGRRMGCAIVPLYQPEARCGYLPCRDRSSVRI